MVVRHRATGADAVDRAVRELRATRRRLVIARETVRERRRFRRTPPVTLNEKIRYRMAFDRRPILRTFSDKLAVREYVADRVGPDILNEIHAVVEHPDDLDLDALPQPCVIKPSHGSGAVIISHPDADPDATIPTPGPRAYWPYVHARVRPERLKDAAFRTLTTRWLQADYANAYGGWCYRGIPRRLIVEKYLGAELIDYRLWVASGRAIMVQVDQDLVKSNRTRSLHLPDWTPVPGYIRYPRPESPPTRPPLLMRMVILAERLACDIDFLRVDLYDVGHRVVFSECTNYPGGGGEQMNPSEAFARIAERWTVPDKPILRVGS